MLHISEPVICDASDDRFVCDAAIQSRDYTFQDINHKSLVLSGSYELRALHLNGENLNQQGNWGHLIPFLAS